MPERTGLPSDFRHGAHPVAAGACVECQPTFTLLEMLGAARVPCSRNIAIGALLGIAMTSLWNSRAQAQTREELFERVFGSSAPAITAPVRILLTVNGEPVGELPAIMPSSGQPMKLDGGTLRDFLEPVLDPIALSSIETAIDADNWVGLDVLPAAGVEAEYNPNQIRLDLVIPTELKRSVVIDLQSRNPPRPVGEIVTPGTFSAFLNARSAVDYVHTESGASADSRTLGRVDFDGAIQLKGNVLEGAVFYAEGGQAAWQRGDIRLVHDDVPRRVRTMLGDVSPATSGFQSTRAMGGLHISRNFSLQPYRPTQPIGRSSYVLKHRSKVEVFVNERLLRTLEQAPGTYEIRDLPFVAGANDVRLRITDGSGNVEELNFPYFFDSLLLAMGEDEFSFGIGLPSRTVLGHRVYDDQRPTVTAFYRFGASDTLTMGWSAQGDPNQSMIGIEGLWASAVGTLGFDLAGSLAQEAGSDFAARLQLRYTDPGSDVITNRALAFSARYIGQRFAALGNLAPDNPVANSFTARYSQQLWDNFNVGVEANYGIGRGRWRDTNSENVSLSYRLARGVTASVSLDRIARDDGAVEKLAFLSLNVALADLQQTLIVTRDTLTDIDRVQWNYTPAQPVGNVSASVTAQRARSFDTYTAGANYVGNRLTAGAAHGVDRPRSEGLTGTSRSQLRFGTALVYVDGHFGVSRPVNDSFVLITRHPNFADQMIGVGRFEDKYKAQSDWLGAAVLPDLTPYIQRNVTIEAPNLPPGYDPGPSVYTLEPTYKSGLRINVGTDTTIFLSGAVVDAQGAPVALQAGQVHSLDEPGREPVTFFTNRNGRFWMEGFKPGRYELRMYFDPSATIQLSIAKNIEGVYEVGTLQLPAIVKKPRGR